MDKLLTGKRAFLIEKKSILGLILTFVTLTTASWTYFLRVRQSFDQNRPEVAADYQTRLSVERLHGLIDTQVDLGLGFFLLGTVGLLDEYRKSKLSLSESLAQLEKLYSENKLIVLNEGAPQLPPLQAPLQEVKRLIVFQKHLQEAFDQAMNLRIQQAEAKSVGYFYRTKTVNTRTNFHKTLEDIAQYHQLKSSLTEQRSASINSKLKEQILLGLSWMTALTSLFFGGMIFLYFQLNRRISNLQTNQQQLRETAAKAALSRDHAVAAISYDFKEPLENLESQIAESVPESAKELKEILCTSINLMRDRIKDIQDNARLETDLLTLRLDQQHLDLILEEAWARMMPLARQKNIRLEVVPALPPVLSFFDSERVLRALTHLLDNAIKFGRKNSRVTVKVKNDQQFVYVIVKDEGPGLTEEQLHTVFECGWQSAGLGLSVVKSIVEAHGGTITADSHPGSGTTFTFSLPRRRPVGLSLGKSAKSATVSHSKSTTTIQIEASSASPASNATAGSVAAGKSVGDLHNYTERI